MAENYVLLETIELSQSAASVTFDNIPQTGYTDLKIVMSARLTTAGYDGTPWVVGEIQLNNTPVSSGKLLYGTGTAAGSDGNANAAFIPDTDATAILWILLNLGEFFDSVFISGLVTTCPERYECS